MKNSVRLGLLCNVSQGITIGGEGCLEIFSITGRKVKIDGKTVSLESDVVCPVIGGGNVKRWKIKWNKEMLIYPYDENGKPIELGVFNESASATQIRKRLNKLIALGVVRHHNVAKYLAQFFEKLSKREFEGKPLFSYGKRWFELHRSRDLGIVGAKPKIVCTRMMEMNRFALDEKGFLILDSCMAIVLKQNGKETLAALRKIRDATKESDDLKVKLILLKYLLGILNSSITELLMKLSVPFLQGRYYQVSESFLSDIPIIIPKDSALIQDVVSAVEDCMKGKNANQKLNQIVYRIYHMDEKSRRAEIEQYISTR